MNSCARFQPVGGVSSPATPWPRPLAFPSPCTAFHPEASPASVSRTEAPHVNALVKVFLSPKDDVCFLLSAVSLSHHCSSSAVKLLVCGLLLSSACSYEAGIK